LTAFLFVGCLPPGPNPDDPDDPDDTIDGVLVEIDGSYEEDGRTYVKGGNNTITVTFPAPVSGMVAVETSECTGDYSKAPIALFPNADRTVWEGSINFTCTSYNMGSPCEDTCVAQTHDCCATTVAVLSGECDADRCIIFPVIVDCEKPTANLHVKAKCCTCEGIELTFKTCSNTPECAAKEEECYDKCSGVAGWSVNIYCGTDPFKKCCEIPCETPIFTESGTGCPIEFTTSCLDCDPTTVTSETDHTYKYFAIFSIWDNVGNVREEAAVITVEMTLADGACSAIRTVTVTPSRITKGEGQNQQVCVDAWNTLFVNEACDTTVYSAE
jgi:hypothetical protein